MSPGRFERGIEVNGSGFTPGADVTVFFRFDFRPDTAGGQVGETTQADDEGRISYLLQPGPGWPGAFLPDLGYPRYWIQAGERGGDGSQVVAFSNEVPLTIQEPAPPAPAIDVPATIPAEELADGVELPFRGFAPGENVTFTISAIIDGEEEILATPEGNADADGAGVLELRITGLTSDLEITIVGVGEDSGSRAEAEFLADVADAPDDSTDPDDPGAGAPAVEGSLPQTGADQSAVTTIAGLGAGTLLLGLIALAVLNRRRIAELVTRR